MFFYDSQGRAIYAGKAEKQSLWKEMNSAFNLKKKKEVQCIKRVTHPINQIPYQQDKDGTRGIRQQTVALHEIASYMSAYEVPKPLISKYEALIIRAFANDLLNKRMESIVAKKQSKTGSDNKKKTAKKRRART